MYVRCFRPIMSIFGYRDGSEFSVVVDDIETYGTILGERNGGDILEAFARDKATRDGYKCVQIRVSASMSGIESCEYLP